MSTSSPALSQLRPGPLVVAVCAGTAAFAWLAARTYERGALDWDRDILSFLRPWARDERVTNSVDALIVAGLWLGLVAAAYLFVSLVVRGRRLDALFWALTIVGVYLLDTALKAALRRPSISGAGDGFSFPSGNAMASAAAVSAVWMLVAPRRRARVLLLGVPTVALYGIGLVYLAWHYPSDVVAGWSLAFAWVALLALSLDPAARRIDRLSRRFVALLRKPRSGPPT